MDGSAGKRSLSTLVKSRLTITRDGKDLRGVLRARSPWRTAVSTSPWRAAMTPRVVLASAVAHGCSLGAAEVGTRVSDHGLNYLRLTEP